MLSEIISADQGTEGSIAGQHAPPVQHHSAATLTQTQFEHAQYAGSGAGSGTVWVMMGTVCLGYITLLVVLSITCRGGRQAEGNTQPFVRFPVMDAESQMIKQVVSDLEPMWRQAFVGKVYGLLVIQIAITLLISVAMMTFGGYDFYVWSLTDGAWTRMAAMLSTFVILLSLICYKNAFPYNLILLFAFTGCMSYTIGVVCTAYAAAGMMMVVVEAFAITSLIFIGLTVFTMQSKINFDFLGAILPMLLFTFIIWGFFSMIAFPSFAMSQTYALIGALIFMLYVLYDTYAITTYLSYDDYVLGAINLYLDFINLFLFILQCLVGMRRD